jgi:hypothetical protein
MSDPKASSSEIAFYYPGHLWHRPEWIKNLLLFFDGIGLLVPEYKVSEPEIVDPILAQPLRDKGLLHYLVADKVVDKDASQKLAAAIGDLLERGAFDSLRSDGTAFHAISRSRMGFEGDENIAGELFAKLKEPGLARPSKDGVSIPLHPLLRYLMLTLLSQILRPKGAAIGLDLYPATDQPRIVEGLTEFLNLPSAPSAGHVVEFDLNTVSIDLTTVPLDEVLDFKKHHGEEHRAYARNIRKFTRELSLLSATERERAFRDRQSELDDLASDLKRRSRTAWRLPASFALGLAGAYWTYLTGDWFGALLGGGAVAVAGIGDTPSEASAFSYLFSARDHYPYY